MEAIRKLTASVNLATVDAALVGLVALVTIWRWSRDRSVSVRLADTRVPNNALMLGLAATRLRRREMSRPFMDLGYAMSELGGLLSEQMKETEQRTKQELQLQVNLEAFARAADARDKRIATLQETIENLAMAADARDWKFLTLQRQIVRFTYVLAVLGIATIGVAIWAATR
ncbi:MAG TPA: hypothetical protein VME01_01980 [Solirubrobacteraceae bacterium]|nr:hypothetical protein [Solirubrobacteraceae bacterium]